MLGSSASKHHFQHPNMEQCELMFRQHTDQHLYIPTHHFLPNLVVFGLQKNPRHFYIYKFQPVSTNQHLTCSDSPHFTLRSYLNQIDLHICFTVRMCVGVVIPSSVGQSASSTSWYISHTIFTYSLRLINVNMTTVISTQ